MVVFSTGILILAISLTDTTIKLTVSTILIVATFVASSTSDEYSLNNYNQANTQRAQTPTYRGTAAPVTQTTAVREDTSKRGNTVYLQQNSYPQDAYQQSTVADYNDNRYDTVADDQAIYRQSSRQPTASRQPPPSLRDDRNELNDVEDDIPKRTTNARKPITTTIRTTTTTTTPRTNPPKKSTQPLSSENVVTAKEQQFNKTISEDSRRNLNNPNPRNTTTHNKTEFRINVDDSVTDDSKQYLKPNPVPTTLKPMFHYITKAPKSTDHISNYTSNNPDITVARTKPITPTTYSPPKFFLKAILPKSLPHPTVGSDTRSSEETVQAKAYKTLKAVRKLINPISVNHELANIAKLASKFITQDIDSQTSQFNFENSASYIHPSDQRTATEEHLSKQEFSTNAPRPMKHNDSNRESTTGSGESSISSINRGHRRYTPSNEPERLIIDMSTEDDGSYEVSTGVKALLGATSTSTSTEDNSYETSTIKKHQRNVYSNVAPKILIDMSTEEEETYESSTKKYLYNNEVSSTPTTYEDDYRYPKRVKLLRTNKFSTHSSTEDERRDEVSSTSKQLINNRILSTTTPKMIIDMSSEDDDDYSLSSTEGRDPSVEENLAKTENAIGNTKTSTISPRMSNGQRPAQNEKLSTLIRSIIGTSTEDNVERYRLYKTARFPHSEQVSLDPPASREEKDDYALSRSTFPQNQKISDHSGVQSDGKNGYRFTERARFDHNNHYRSSKVQSPPSTVLPKKAKFVEYDYDYKSSSTEELSNENMMTTTPSSKTTTENDYDYRSSSTEEVSQNSKISSTENDYDYKSSSTEYLAHSITPPPITEMSTSTEDDSDYRLYKEARLLQFNKVTTASPKLTTLSNKQSKELLNEDISDITETNEVSDEYLSDRSGSSEELDNFVPDERNKTVVPINDSPLPIFKPKKPNPETSKSEIPQSTSPGRVSRVNAAIKSLLAVGGRTKCPNDRNPKCNEVKPRTNNRGRGSAHYGGVGTQITNNEVTFNTNRGTPAPRSRPTLKPTTSIVSKSQEFVDIYRHPPRRPSPIYPQPQPDKTAAKCRKDVCLLPDCSCGGRDIPGKLYK
ncbi:unnamed protein product, partial [Callosobruchus maculatus]